MLGIHRLGAITEVRILVTKLLKDPAVLLKLKLVPVSDYLKNMEYTGDKKFSEVYVCQNCHNI